MGALKIRIDGVDYLVGGSSGATVCTSTTKPTTPYDGQLIYETNTERFYLWIASVSAWKYIGGGDHPVQYHRCMLSKNVSQTVGNASEDLVTWQVEEIDIPGTMGGLVNNRINIIQDGIYVISGAVQWTGALTAGKACSMALCVNGLAMANDVFVGVGNASNRYNQNYTETTLRLYAGDLITMEVLHNDGGNFAIDTIVQTASNPGTFLEAIQINR